MQNVDIYYNQRGFLTLEILLAMAFLVLVISMVLPLVSGAQSISVDLQVNQEALYKAQQILEDARVAGRTDFASLVSFAPIGDKMYQKQMLVNPESTVQCAKDVKSRVSWLQNNRQLSVDLSSRVTDINGMVALGGDCDIYLSASDWHFPKLLANYDVMASQTATGIDVLGSIVFISTKSSVASNPDLFIVDATDPTRPTLLSSIDIGPGLNAIDVAAQVATGSIFAYVASDSTTSQFKIIDVDKSGHFKNPALIASFDLQPSSLGTDSQAKSIFYYDKKVYVGTNYLPALATARPEFHIFDVSNPALSFETGFYNLNHNINAIMVRGNYAYLATSDDHGEVWVLNINNPVNPILVSKFDAPGPEDGQSLYLLGNTLYLGRNHAPPLRSDFYALDVLNPTIINVLGSKNLSLSPSSAAVTGIRANGRFAYLATSDSHKEFLVLDMLHPENIPLPLSTYHFDQQTPSIDFENDKVYVPGNIISAP